MRRRIRITSVAFVGLVTLGVELRIKRGRPKRDPQGTGSDLACLVCQRHEDPPETGAFRRHSHQRGGGAVEDPGRGVPIRL